MVRFLRGEAAGARAGAVHRLAALALADSSAAAALSAPAEPAGKAGWPD